MFVVVSTQSVVDCYSRLNGLRQLLMVRWAQTDADTGHHPMSCPAFAWKGPVCQHQQKSLQSVSGADNTSMNTLQRNHLLRVAESSSKDKYNIIPH